MVTSLLVFVMLSSSFLMIKPALAQISPSVPEFTLKFDNESYDVPQTNTTQGYHVEKEFIDVIINNKNPYSFYAVVNESLVKLYYNIRAKDHSQDWANAIVSPNLAPSNSNYTTVKFGLGSVNPDPGGYSIWIGNITTGSEVDFQVQGIDGFYTKLTQENPPCWRIPQFSVFNETGRSGWSNTQTINISGSISQSGTAAPVGTSPTPASTPGSAANDLNLIILAASVAVVIMAVSLGALIYLRRPRKQRSS